MHRRLLPALTAIALVMAGWGISASTRPCDARTAQAKVAKRLAPYPPTYKAGTTAKGTAAEAAAGKAKAAGNNCHSECDACTDMAICEGDLKAAGAVTQTVPLKNGVMFVVTAENPSQVRAVQAAMARGNERWNAIMAGGDKSRLCAGCKALRGAAASGKLTREIVNIEGGGLTLLTSSDPAIVARLHGILGTHDSASSSARGKM